MPIAVTADQMAMAESVGQRARNRALCGADGAADGASAGPVDQFLLTRCLTIAGGTSQILMSLAAERLLGLPREEVR